MAEVDLAIYKTPIQADKLGKTITKTQTITKTEAKQLRDYYNQIGSQQKTALALIATLVGGYLGKVTGVVFGITYTLGSTKIQTYFENLGSQFATLVDDMCKSETVTFTYTYKRHGSNDGAYWLTKVTG